jgi:opacity protein-like surface antigen
VRDMTRLLAVSLLLIASFAHAQTAFPPPEPASPRGPYAGVLVGSSEAKPGCVGVLAGGDRNCDATDLAFGVFAGAQFHRFLAAEVGYVNFGEMKANSAGPASTATQSVSADAFDLALLAILPLDAILETTNSRVSFFLRGGGYHARLSTTVGGVPDSTNNGFMYGGGVQYDITQKIGVRAFFQRYKRVGRDAFENNNYDVLGISALYRFR